VKPRTIGVTFGGLLAGADAKYASGCRLLVALVDVSDDRLTSFIDVDVLGVGRIQRQARGAWLGHGTFRLAR